MTISEQKLSSLDTAAGVFSNDGNGVGGGADGMANNDGKDVANGNGKWCGNAWGYNVYYSESSSVNISLKLFKFAQQSQLSLTPKDDNFSFRITYKFLRRSDAKSR